MKDPIVGIDLGTSNSVVAFADEAGVVKVLADDGGYKIHPSCVSFHPNGGVIVGAAAKQRKVIDPANTIYSVKRLIGRSFNSTEVATAISRSPFKIQSGANNAPMIVTRGGEFAIPELSAIVLDHMRNIAGARLGTPVSRAVVTVPASFNDAQRSATATAGAIAGLTVVRVLNEPTAAALAYGHTRNLKEVIAVYDFGGGTFDISLLRLDDQVYEVIGTAGDTFLGGDDLDERLVDKMVAKFLAENRIDLRTNEVAMMRLRAVAEQTKIELSRRSRAVVRIDEIAYGAKGAPLNLQIEISRDEFVNTVADIIDRTFPVCQEALAVAGIGPDAISDVILVGGTTKIPYVRDQVAKFFARSPRTDVNPEDAVAIGAALQATSIDRVLSKPARNPSRQIPVQRMQSRAESFGDVTGESLVDDSFTDVAPAEAPSLAGVTMAPNDELVTGRPKRETFDYAHQMRGPTDKPDTSYSITRGGKESVALPAPVTGEFETSTPPPNAAPLARLTRQPSQPISKKTMFGVASAPPPIPPLNKPSTEKMPPLTRGPASTQTDPGLGSSGPTLPAVPALPKPPPARSDDDWLEPGDMHDSVTMPSTTQPLAPVRPIAPPTAPTLVTLAPDFEDEIASVTGQSALAASAASTTRGMGSMNTEQAEAFRPPPTTTKPGPPARGPAQMPTQVLPPPVDPYPPPPTFAPPPPPSPFAPPAYQAPSTFEPEPLYEPPAYEPPLATVAPLSFVNPASAFPEPMPLSRSAPVILEVTPRGLGIATVAGFCEELIRRNSRLPTEIKRVFATSRDRQPSVRIVVCQGESRRLDNNTIIGDLVLQNLPPRPRGETEIEVTFMLDASGILQVHARDKKTGAEQRASLDLVGGVAQQDVAASRERIQQLRR